VKKVVIIISIVGLLTGAFFVYRWLNKPKVDPWAFVPAKSALVFESHQLFTDLDSLENTALWQAFSGHSDVQRWSKFKESIEALDEGAVMAAYRNTHLILCVQSISKHQFDALMVINTTGGDRINGLRKVLHDYQEQGYRRKTRRYNGFEIVELFNEPDKPAFSYFWKGDYLVGSTSAILVEDAIRTYNEDSGMRPFIKTYAYLFDINPLSNDQGNVYINHAGFASLLSGFLQSEVSVSGKASFLDVQLRDNYLKLTGFTFPSPGILSTLHTRPTGMDLLDLVPGSTAVLHHYSFEDPIAWRDSLKQLSPAIEEASQMIQDRFDLDVSYLMRAMGTELAMARQEQIDAQDPANKIAYWKTRDADRLKAFLDQLNVRMSEDSLFMDRVGEYEIKRMEGDLLFEALAGDLLSGQKLRYYTFHRENFIVSNSLAVLKRLIRDIAQDDTWKKSISVNEMLDLSSREANYTLIYHVPAAWNEWNQQLEPGWLEWMENNTLGFKSLRYITLQMSRVENKFYTSFLAFQPEPPRQPSYLTESQRLQLTAQANTEPFVFIHDGGMEILLQDTAKVLSHFDPRLRLLWRYTLPAAMVGEPEALDFYKNGKTQYALVSNNQIFVIDRTGNMVEGFPRDIPVPEPVVHFSVVDYDGSRNYRFMYTDAEGNIYLTDKQGNLLEGWKPQVTGDSLIAAPRHVRLAGTDAYIVLKDNALDVFMRRGKSFPGFPVSFDEALVPEYFIEAAGTFQDSKITLLTVEGELISLNLTGQTTGRIQLTKVAANTRFELVPDRLGQTFLIIRSDDLQWEILDHKGNALFQKDYMDAREQTVQFYRFSGQNVVISVVNEKAGFVSLYDLEGNPLLKEPLRSSEEIALLYSEAREQFTIFLIYHDELRRLTMRR
jgi:hypothetical protein